MENRNRIAILTVRNRHDSDSINWDNLGTVIEELSQLYQLVKEQHISLVLYDYPRFDIKRPVATKIRRYNGQTEIWRVVEHEGDAVIESDFLDGVMARDLGRRGISAKVKQILKSKDLMTRYGIVGRSPIMKAVTETVERIAPTDVTVLVVGPSGSGKELIASAIHNDSSRRNGPFVAINCSALSEGVLESELFGHEKGAFTGSVGKREGLFAKAEGGTVFLDEIGETRSEMQVKLLRVLEDGTYYPVGSSTPQKANVRVVAATNRDLTEALHDKLFREDLYYRISAVKIIVPPLLERKSEIQPLLQHFWRTSDKLDYTDSALELLMKYDWPGNVRQLKNFADRMAAFKPAGMIDTNDVERFLAEQHSVARNLPVTTGKTTEEAGQELIYRAIMSLGNEVRVLRDLITANLPGSNDDQSISGLSEQFADGTTVELMERSLIERTLSETGGNRKETAQRLGIGERTLYRKLKKYGLS